MKRRARLGVSLAAALAVVLAAASVVMALTQKHERPRLGAREPLRAPLLRVQDCQGCHPRQAAEWRRSVMAYSVRSPLFQALEMLIEEQVGREAACPEGAGVLREPARLGACRDQTSLLTVTGSGGEGWCVNCHAPAQNLAGSLPAWNGQSSSASGRRPLRDLMSPAVLEGISCAACHEVTGPVRPGRGYQGNPFWTSTSSGQRFEMRPEDRRGSFGISNSGYLQDPRAFLSALGASDTELVTGGAHRRMSESQRAYLRSSQFCGSCHDVRLFGTDVLGVRGGEHFKRLRNAYSEWQVYAGQERARGRKPASCQDCHMSAYPSRPPGTFQQGLAAIDSPKLGPVYSHYFSGVDLPLATEFEEAWLGDPTLDAAGTPLGARQRRDALLRKSAKLSVGRVALRGGRLEVPLSVENVGAGHRIPAGFSQERELWLHVRVSDRRGRVVYEAGRIDRDDQDLGDKLFLRVNTDGFGRDAGGRSLGLFGADVRDGPDLPRWQSLGSGRFVGSGLVNFQNGFLRCVRCIGEIAPDGSCRPGPGQGLTRADRYADGDYDPDTGACRSNLGEREALFETYFPVGALDAERGVIKAPDAIIDTRSLPPGRPVEYLHELVVDPSGVPFRVEARLMFRAFPPYLIRAFAAYEEGRARSGQRPSGPLISERVLERIEMVELERVEAVGP